MEAGGDPIIGDIDGPLAFVESQSVDQVGPKSTAALMALRASKERVTPPGSQHQHAAREIMESEAAPWPNEKAEQMQGILTAFKADYEAGRVKKFAGLIQGDLLSDFLEMAAHLAGENYKDAAAVIAGSVLEEHTRKLAEGRGIEVERADGRAHKFETLNAELRKAEPPTYSEAERKQLAAWYGLRTDAAHARRDEYTLEEVRLMIEGIRGFLIRYPA